MKKVLSNLWWMLALIAVDAASKMWALGAVPMLRGSAYPFGGWGLFHDIGGVSLSLNTAFNTGTAWGLFPDHLHLLLALRLCIIGALLVHLFFSKKSALALWLVAAGAIGNVIDMVAYGHVVDFFHFQFFGWSFPIFNVADSCISLGVILLLLWPQKTRSLSTESPT